MRKKNGFTLTELIAVLVLLTVIVTISIVTYNGVQSNILKKEYENVQNTIKVAAKKYASDTGRKVVFVETLINEGIISADDDKGIIYNPEDKSSLNCYYYNTETGALESGFIEGSEDTCNYTIANTFNVGIDICDKETNTCESLNPDKWYSGPQILKATDVPAGDVTIKWLKSLNLSEYITEEELEIEANGKEFIDETYQLVVTSNTGGEQSTVNGRVKIDFSIPTIESVTTDIPNSTWSRKKNIIAVLKDSGSKIKEYRILNNGAVVKAWTTLSNAEEYYELKQEITKAGNYVVEIKDSSGLSTTSEPIEVSNIDTNSPTLVLKSNPTSVIKRVSDRNESLETKYVGNKYDTGGSGIKSLVIKSNLKSTNVVNTNDLPLGAQTLTFTLTDNAGNVTTQSVNVPVTVSQLSLAEELRTKQTCTGAAGSDCYVKSNNGSINYVSYAGRTYRAYLVTGANLVKVIELNTINNVKVPLGYLTEVYVNRCCNAGCPYWASNATIKYIENNTEMINHLSQYFNTVNQASGNNATEYLTQYSFNNSSSGSAKTYKSYIGGITVDEYRQIANCTGNSCTSSYLTTAENHWTITPINDRTTNVGEGSTNANYYFISSSRSIGNTHSSKRNNAFTNTQSFYPVIVFNSNVMIKSGNGTSADPYQLELRGEN